MSFRTTLCKWMIGMQNINPIKNKDAITKMQKMSEKYIKDKVKKGLVLEHFETKNHTKYQILKKKETKEFNKIVLYFHGGCYIAGLTYNYYSFVDGFLDIKEDMAIVLLDYKLAPEYKYPTQLNEALDLYDEILHELHIDKDNIVLGGDSSGGNLCLSFLLKLKESVSNPVNRVFLLSPWTDMEMSGKTYIDNYTVDIQIGDKKGKMTEEVLKELKESELFCFIPKGMDKKEPYISPLYGDYSNFPKSLFFVGGDEMLLDDTRMVVKKLGEAKQDVGMVVENGMFHSYVLCKNMMPESKKAYRMIQDFIQEAFNK